MKENVQILIVEDDIDINALLTKVLKKEGYETTSAYSGTEAKLLLNMSTFDLVLLDLTLPGASGQEIVQLIRQKSYIPIIVISANSALDDKISLLSEGADDYITKPFEIKEVLARVEAQVRRYCKFAGENEIKKEGTLSYKNIVINKQARSVQVNGQEIPLTNHEYEILVLFVTNINRVFTRESIYQSVWSDEYAVEDNTVNVHISNLRSKLHKADPKEEYIKTVWGIGFKMI
ncbi:MAG: response regulator transcription factor [bacterium]|nr:response regulator transcription factor [bacterium]